MKKKMIFLLLVISASLSAEFEEGVAYPYPYEERESYLDSVKKPEKKMASPPAWQGKIGAAEVTVDVVNDDEASRHKYEWEQVKNKRRGESKKRSSSSKEEDEKKEDDRAPGVRFTMKWGGK